MAIAIRLTRGGAKKRPYYRIVVADSRAPRDGRYIEKIGSYNPLLPKDHADRVKLDTERAKYWLGEGARPSDRVGRFFADEGLMKPVTRNNPQKAKPGKKALERIEMAKQKQEKAKAAAEEAKAAEAAAAEAPAEEAPAEEVVAEVPAEEVAAEETPAEEAAAEEVKAEEASEEAPAEEKADEAAEEAPAEEEKKD